MVMIFMMHGQLFQTLTREFATAPSAYMRENPKRPFAVTFHALRMVLAQTGYYPRLLFSG